MSWQAQYYFGGSRVELRGAIGRRRSALQGRTFDVWCFWGHRFETDEWPRFPNHHHPEKDQPDWV